MVDSSLTTALTDIERQAVAALASPSSDTSYVTLSGALRDIFLTHERSRKESGVEQAMVEGLFAFNSRYLPEKQAALKAAGLSTTYFGLIGEKCTDALSWLLDVFLGESSKPWRLKSTPVPDVPQELSELALSTGIQAAREYQEGLGREITPEDNVRAASLVRQAMQDAILVETDRRAKQMERLIDDALTEGGWKPALKDFLFDVAVGKAAILKGPIVRERQKKVWGTGSGGKPKVSYVWEPALTVSRVSPFDAYPSASTVEFEGDFIERIRFRLSDVFWMLKRKHFIKSQVQSVIDDFPSLAGTEVRAIDSTVAPILQNQTGEAKVQGTVEGLNYWLTVPGTFLRNAGYEKFPAGKSIVAGELYHIEALTLAGRVVFVDENPDPRGQKPYFKTGWQSIPGSFWYRSLPEILADIGDVCNADVRSLVNNMGLASGFQVIIPDTQRLLGDKLTTMFPHKIWQFKNPSNSAAPPIDFKQPDSNAQELLGIINECRQWADSRSGVPKYLVGGQPPPGVGRTASGISMLFNSAAKGIRRVVIAVDLEVICPLLEAVYERKLVEAEDAAVLGDLEVAPAGAVETLVKSELAERRLALIGELSKSPDADLVGVRGRSAVWREAFRSVEMEGPAIMAPIEKIEQKAEAVAKAERTKAEAEAQAMQMDAQNKSLEVEISKAKLDVERQRFAMESKILGLKLEAQITENQQRAAITKRMASSVDLKTAEQLGQIGVQTDEEEEEENDIRVNAGNLEALGTPPAVPGVAGAPEGVEAIPTGESGMVVNPGGGPLEPSAGGGPTPETVV